MKKEILDKIRSTSPKFVLDSLYEDYVIDAIGKIREGYAESNENRMNALKDIVGLIILKDIRIEDLFKVIKEALKLDEKIAREIALIILCEILYPIKDYFPGIEDEILKLGGEVPRISPKKITAQLLNREEEIEAMEEAKRKEEEEKMADTIINKTIENLIKEYPKVGECAIGSQKAIEIKEMPLPMQPLIKYWLKDYQEKMGYVWHSNIDRAHYVYQDKNTKDMNEEERRQLNLILKSLDEKITLPYSTRLKKIDFSKINNE